MELKETSIKVSNRRQISIREAKKRIRCMEGLIDREVDNVSGKSRLGKLLLFFVCCAKVECRGAKVTTFADGLNTKQLELKKSRDETLMTCLQS